MIRYNVTIIIPVFNGENNIRRCYASIKDQTLEKIEILFVDNNSTDDSSKIIRSIGDSDSDVRLISEQVQGAGAARNFGIEMATGKYIFFLDVDDFIPDRKALEVLYNTSENNGNNISGGRLLWYRNGTLDTEKTKNHPLNIRINNGEKKIEYKDYQYDYGYYAFLYKTTFLKNNNLLFPPFLRHQDPPFFVKAMIKSNFFLTCDVDSYAYMSGNNCGTMSGEKAKDIVKACRMELEIANKYELEKLASYVIDHLNSGNYCWQIAMGIEEDLELLYLLMDLENYIQDSFPLQYQNYGGIKSLRLIGSFPRLIRHRDVLLDKKDGALEKKNESIDNLRGIIQKKDDALTQKNGSIDNLRGIIQRKDLAIEEKNDIIRRKGWIFPYDKVKKGASIVIWGAGDVGTDFYSQIEATNYCSIIAWVDQNYLKMNDSRVTDPDCFFDYDFDYIVIASSKKEIISEVKDYLTTKNIHKDMIVESFY